MIKSLWRRKAVPSDEADGRETALEQEGSDELTDKPSTISSPIITHPGQPENPILSDEDELFLRRAVSHEEGPDLPPRPIDATYQEDDSNESEVDTEGPDTQKIERSRWEQYKLSRDRNSTADDLMSAAEAVKAQAKTPETSDSETSNEKSDVKTLLNRLDLSAINNRVVGLSDDTQKLLENFNQILKDLVNGVPTAYDDLEKLLTERQKQLDKLYGSLPPFLQTLVKSVPARAYAFLAPQFAAAMKSGKTEDTSDTPSQPEDGKNKSKKRIVTMPSLKQLVTEKGAVVAMLRSIVSFIETRFPALLAGTNVVMSVAVFVLLFVFWYCHKRGREVRLDKEQSISTETTADAQVQDIEIQMESQEADTEVKRQIEAMAKEIERQP